MTGERKEEQHVQRLGGATDAAHTGNSSDAASVLQAARWSPQPGRLHCSQSKKENPPISI